MFGAEFCLGNKLKFNYLNNSLQNPWNCRIFAL